MKPVASTVFTRLVKALTLALVLEPDIAAYPCSAAADETSKASRQTGAAAAPSSPVVTGRQRIFAHPIDRDPATTYVEELYKQLMRSAPP